MLSFSTLTVLAIATQSLFANVDAAVLPKRQTGIPSQGGGNLIDCIIPSNFSITGLFNFSAAYSLDNQGTNQLGSLPDLIPAALNCLTGTNNNVSLIGVPGLSPSSIGLGITPVNGTGSGGFDPTSIFSQLADTLSKLLNATIFPISPPSANGSFPTTAFLTFPGFNGTTSPFPELNGTTPSFPGLNDTTTTPPFPELNGTATLFPEFNGTFPPAPESNGTTPPVPESDGAIPPFSQGTPSFTLPVSGEPTVPPFPDSTSSSADVPAAPTPSDSSDEPVSTDGSDEPVPTDA